MAPVVRFETSPSVLVESEGTALVFTFQLSEAPPSGGITVTVNGNVPQNLTQLNLFDITVTGGEFPVGDTDFSGFDFKITSQTATISIPIFQDGNAEDPATVTYTLAPGQGYTVDPSASQDSVIFRDDPAPVENRPPVANDDSGSIPENQILSGNVLTNDSDPDGDTVTISEVDITLDSGALLNFNSDGSYTYNPNGQFNYLNDGQTTGDSFSYTISDGRGGTDTAIVSLTIIGITQTTPTNQNPIAVNDTGSIPEDRAFGGNVLSNDGDPDGDSLVVSAINGTTNIGLPFALPSGAVLILNADGGYNYNPNGQFNYLTEGQTATDSFNYSISDGKGGVATATATITIQGITDVLSGFDPAQYSASNPDLIPIFGYNLPALTNHYVSFGRFEGRSSDSFDEYRYIASNSDLLNALGANGAGATEHYINYGYGEGRSTTAFDSARYLLSNSDLLNVYGTNVLSASYHYVAYGSKPPENQFRNPNAFPSDRYIATYPDLIGALGYNLVAGSEHYLYRVYTGAESRSISFSPENYLALNTDVAAHPYFGQSLANATQHYILYGSNEGRSWM